MTYTCNPPQLLHPPLPPPPLEKEWSCPRESSYTTQHNIVNSVGCGGGGGDRPTAEQIIL